MSCKGEELIEHIEEAAAKARAKNGGAPAKRLEMSKAWFDILRQEGGLPELDEIEVEFDGKKSIIAPNETLKDNQFIFEFD